VLALDLNLCKLGIKESLLLTQTAVVTILEAGTRLKTLNLQANTPSDQNTYP